MRRKKILLVDDHPLLREGLSATLDREDDLEVCGGAGSAAEALALAARTSPDLVIADMKLPDRSGLELIKDLRALYPRLPVLVISMCEESFYAERVLRAGGRGYLMKSEPSARFLESVRRVLRGDVCFSAEASSRLLESLRPLAAQRARPAVEELSDRELEVLQLMGWGRSTKEIASQLRISAKTVEAHRAHIKDKLGLKSGAELVRYAIQWVVEHESRGAAAERL